MASVVNSFTINGIEGHLVEVETDTIMGMHSVSIVGLADTAVKEAKERLEAALSHLKFSFPPQKVLFNLAPSDMKKSGTHFDLPMAIGILLRTNQIKPIILMNDTGFIGELSLNACVRPVSGVLPMAVKAREIGITQLIVANENLREAKLVKGIEVCGCKSLREVIDFLEGKNQVNMQPQNAPKLSYPNSIKLPIDFEDVKGHEILIDFITIAAAGGHNMIMVGPPGCGKSMIAKRIPTILPSMNDDEALEVTKIYSVANLLKHKGYLIKERPFRSPHHNASPNSLIGGGRQARPGEISLAHNGVLFLDEIAEFSKKALEALRQPLEDRIVTVTRVSETNTYPASFMLVAAMNPCPCGYYGQEKCRCTDYEIIKYRQKISGPILDRMDIQKYVSSVNFFDNNDTKNSSTGMRTRITMARQKQYKRYSKLPHITSNAQLTPALLKEFCHLDHASLSLLQKAHERLHYSGRSIHKIIKVARTIADLDNSDEIHQTHIMKSLMSRDLDKDDKQFVTV